jgi:WD40 repeat protein/DNA-binding SARP family transcriptional activator
MEETCCGHVDGRLEFGILGPLEVRAGSAAVHVGGPKQRALLALLLLSANRVVSRDRLLDELISGEAGGTADHTLRVQVSRLRKALDPSGDEPRLVARPPGYLLRVEPGELDLELFEQALAAGRKAREEGHWQRAADLLRDGLALWRGRPLADLEFEPFARIDVERLEELRLSALEERIEAELELGSHAALVPELEALTAEHPLRERLRSQLMLALYRCGRQAEGLDVYRQTRTLLREELGLEPGVALRQLERAMLAQDPSLQPLPQPVAAAITTVRAREAADLCPFKGLAAFGVADADFFFGRDRLLAELRGLLSETSFAAAVGPSGSGKSSLLRAGLLPALAEAEERHPVVMRPGEHPAAELRRVLAGAREERSVVCVDQFEELFTACTDEGERRAFVRSLVELAWDPERNALVVIALRDDFYARLSSYPELAELVRASHVLVGPMSARDLRRAIAAPAERVGLMVEPVLVEALVRDVSHQAAGLPLLSTTLLELWEQRQGDALTLDQYEQVGGVEGAVARLAEAAYARLSDEQQQIARRILLRLAVAGDGEAPVGRRVSAAELDLDQDDETAHVLAVLIESRVLTAAEGRIEVGHEALLTEWPRLRDWLTEDTEGRALHRHLTRAATEWEEAGRDPGELYRGVRLAGALEWRANHNADLNAREREFLEQSELEATEEIARERRTVRRLRSQRAVAGVLLLLAIIGGVVAFQQRGQARRSATAAIAGRLGAQALDEPSLDRSLLLAREAVNLDDSAVTRSNLLAALQRSPAALAILHTPGTSALADAVSPDGRTLAVLDSDGDVSLFDTRTLRLRGKPFSAGTDYTTGFGSSALSASTHPLAFSPDGRTLAVGGSMSGKTTTPSTLALIDTRTGRIRANVKSVYTFLTADVVFSPDGHVLLTGENGEGVPGGFRPETIVVRSPADGHMLARSSPIPDGRLIGFTAGGRSLLVTSGDARSLLLDPRSFKTLRTFPLGGAAALSPSLTTAAFGQADGTVTLLDLRSGRQQRMTTRATGSVLSVAFSPDGKTVSTTADDGSVALWDVASGAERESFLGHASGVNTAAFSPDGRTLYSAGRDGTVIVWDAAGNRRLVRSFQFVKAPPPDGTSAAGAVTADGTLLATSPGKGRIILMRTRTLEPVATLRGALGDIAAISFGEDGRTIAAGGSTGAVVWAVAGGKVIRTLRHAGGILALSPDGHTVAAGDLKKDRVDVYDVRTGRREAKLGLEGSVSDIDFSPDGKLLVAGDLGAAVTVWNTATWKRLFRTGLPHGGAVFTEAFSPDGKLIASGDSNGTVAFWDAGDGHEVGSTVTGLNGGISSVAFDPSGSTLAVSSNGTLQLFDVSSRRPIGAPVSGAGGSTSFLPDGKRVFAVAGDGTALLWNVDPAAWEARACHVAHRNLSRAEWHDFLPNLRYRAVCS